MDPLVDLVALSDDPIPYFQHPDPATRRLAVSIASSRTNDAELAGALSRLLAGDDSARVRAETAEALGRLPGTSASTLLAAATDAEPIVAEAVASALGEIGSPEAVPWLIEAATSHNDRLVREAAVAALGALADERARPVLLDLVVEGPPQVRRRCVVALTVFDGPDIEAALADRLRDRNPMVREAAEMVVGRPVEGPSD